jgi:hypothetical protein
LREGGGGTGGGCGSIAWTVADSARRGHRASRA